ncbi:nucleoside deaminase [Mucilaginibacter phyllosphaerae]|uniref:Nucleoside deaminase n=1 Tax=Mucilaginibacter phyllosphaerae TaxID=1812349 RepID=A0A4Y8AHX4_9SPHI|nr:nucleoside deaminase [Mucilaginibacter phyllosphaerae]MBB3968617.1 tRNA(Arg) A34 adenosine deaminase TadA [Mucilaginibacter phyllosphaerae]TEW67745.1 nucleoside deaminase [Mucilaginibacter phyllosphaerae]GGH14910.1 tRNA-specific adenosine deaminase [Mucilaginibacter phyllosphaerae]
MENKGTEKFMQMAIELSEYNVKQGLGGPFGAVIVKGGMVIARSANRVVPTNDPTAHAEVSVIRLACQELGTYNLEGCEIYTSCEPCPMCLGAIYWARIDKIYFANTKKDAADIGFDDHFIYDELALPMEKRKLPFVQMMHNEAFAIFKQWEISDEKDNY